MAQRGCDETRMRSPNSPGTQAAARSRRAAQKPSRRARRAPRCGRRTFKKNAHSPVPVCRRFEPALPRPQAALNKSGEPAAAGAVLLFLLFIPIYYMAALRARVLRKSEAGRRTCAGCRADTGAANAASVYGRLRRCPAARGGKPGECPGRARFRESDAAGSRLSARQERAACPRGRRGALVGYGRCAPVWPHGRRGYPGQTQRARAGLAQTTHGGAGLLFPGGSATIVNCKIREKSPAAPFCGALSERKEFLCPPIKS